MHRGWAKIHRKIFDNQYWQEKPFTRGQAWVDIILLANHKDGFLRKRGVLVTVERGQLGHSQNTLADRWGWSRGKVIRFLNELETAQQIVQQKNNVTSLITVANYSEYQSDSTADSTANGTTDGLQTVPEQECKKEKNEKKKTGAAFSVPEWVDKELWKDFLVMRNKIKKPVTSQRAVSGLTNKLKGLTDQGYSQSQLFEAALVGCWQTFYAPKDEVKEPEDNYQWGQGAEA